MLEEEARRRSKAHAPPHADAWETGLFCTVCACESRTTFPAIELGGWGLRRPAHLPMGEMSCHALPNTVFQKHTF